MNKPGRNFFFNKFLESNIQAIPEFLNTVAVESFLHLAEPTEAWQAKGLEDTCTVPKILEGTV